MSKTAAAIHHGIRVRIDDLDSDAYAISSFRMDAIVKAKASLIASRAWLPMQPIPTTVTLQSGVYDYELSVTPKSVRQVILDSTGAELSRTTLEAINRFSKPDSSANTSVGPPGVFALFETTSATAGGVHGTAPRCYMRVAPTPTGTDTLDVYYQGYLATSDGTLSSSAIVALSPMLTAALEMSCAAECVAMMDSPDRQRRKISPDVVKLWMAESDALIREENTRYKFARGLQAGVVRGQGGGAGGGGSAGGAVAGVGWGFNWGNDWGGA